MGTIAKWTRRTFIGAGALVGGGLILGVTASPNRLKISGDGVADEGETILNTWVKISPDNQVTAIIPHSEMGQGATTGLAMMLAEEMDADWTKVDFIEAPATDDYANNELGRAVLVGEVNVPGSIFKMIDYTMFAVAQQMNMQVTGGSMSIRTTGEFGMRRAGASARHMLLEAAAQEWGVDVADLTAKNSTISHAGSGKSATYGGLASLAAQLEPPMQPALKDPKKFELVGTTQPRFDIPAKVDGSAEFGIDVEVDGMLYAAIRQAPVYGGKVKSVDESAIAGRRGIKKVVVVDGDSVGPIQTILGSLATENGVAVVADNYWRAEQALADLSIEWDNGDASGVSDMTIAASYKDVLDAGEGKADVKKGDAEQSVDGGTLVEAEYSVPFLAHAAMEPLNCTAWVRDGKCDIWVGHQNPLGARGFAAKAAGLKETDVMVHNKFLGGGFGRRATADFVVQSVLIAKEVGAPVKLVWSREEDMKHDRYRPAVANRMKAVLGQDGKPFTWSNLYTNTGQNEPVDAPWIPYGIANQLIRGAEYETPVPLGAWRSVGHTQHSFFNESFIDELAHAAGADPYEYRRELLKNAPRHKAVLELAAEKAGWGGTLPSGHALGIALEQSFDSIVAQVAEVSIDERGKPKIHKVTAAIDCGLAVNRGQVEAQVQSGIIYGLTAALYGQINIENGGAVQANFPGQYEMVRLNEAPIMDVHVLNSYAKTGGAGEPGTPPISAAVANAIFVLTGERVRRLPLNDYEFKPKELGPQLSKAEDWVSPVFVR